MCRLEAAKQAPTFSAVISSRCAFFTVTLPTALTVLSHHYPSSCSAHLRSSEPTPHHRSLGLKPSMDLEHTPNQLDRFDPSTPKTSDRRPPLNQPPAAPHATEVDNTGDDFVCSQCRQVDWASLPALFEGSWSRKFRPREYWHQKTIDANSMQLATSSCKICRILSVVKPQPLDTTECEVKAVSLYCFNSYIRPFASTSARSLKTTALYVWPRDKFSPGSIPSRCLVAIKRDTKDFCSRITSPRSIDYGWLRSLAQSCEESHKLCGRRGSHDPVSVPGLKVIEVLSRAVIQAPPDCRYVALSYVWGKQPAVGRESHLQNPPRLIEDAISVTIAMGYKYLWIDKYVSLYNNGEYRCIETGLTS